MREKTTTAIITGAVLTGAAGLALTVGAVVPALADTATTDETTQDGSTTGSAVTDHLARLKEALAGLVTDGTLTQDQADKVAETLDGSDVFRGGPDGMHGGPGIRGGPGGGMELGVAAETLGLEEDALRDLLRDGGTLADVAEAQGVEVSTLVGALVTAATDHIDAEVADGSLDQARADEMKTDLESRITQMVQEGMPMRGGHGDRGGPMGEEG